MQSDARQEAGLTTTISVNKRKYEKLSSMISPLTKVGGGSYNKGSVLQELSCKLHKKGRAWSYRRNGI